MKCGIKGCSNEATRKAEFDVGPTLGDALVADSARIHKIGLCDDHARLVERGTL